MTTPPAGGFGGHALQGGRIGLILVAHGHRVVPVTQHGRQDASLSGSDEAQGILGADRQHGVRRVRRAIVGRRADGQDPGRQQHRSGVALAVVDKGCVDVDAVAHAQPASQRPEIGDGHIQGAHSCWQCKLRRRRRRRLPGGLAQQMCRQDDLARIDIR